MPVREKREMEAYCDVCGNEWSQSCAICGGVFCGEHAILIEFKRQDRGLRRHLCKKCLSNPQSRIMDTIGGYDPQSWKGKQVDFPEVPGFVSFVSMQTDKAP